MRDTLACDNSSHPISKMYSKICIGDIVWNWHTRTIIKDVILVYIHTIEIRILFVDCHQFVLKAFFFRTRLGFQDWLKHPEFSQVDCLNMYTLLNLVETWKKLHVSGHKPCYFLYILNYVIKKKMNVSNYFNPFVQGCLGLYFTQVDGSRMKTTLLLTQYTLE